MTDGEIFSEAVRLAQRPTHCNSATVFVHYLNNFQLASDILSVVYYLTVALYTSEFAAKPILPAKAPF